MIRESVASTLDRSCRRIGESVASHPRSRWYAPGESSLTLEKKSSIGARASGPQSFLGRTG